jgi:hypothetical protein
VDGEQPVRREDFPIQIEGLASQQVNRDGIAVEGVDDQEVKRASCPAGSDASETRVSSTISARRDLPRW